MQWSISGADRETGKDRTITVGAATREEAAQAAAQQGLFVATVTQLPVADYAAPTTPPAAAPTTDNRGTIRRVLEDFAAKRPEDFGVASTPLRAVAPVEKEPPIGGGITFMIVLGFIAAVFILGALGDLARENLFKNEYAEGYSADRLRELVSIGKISVGVLLLVLAQLVYLAMKLSQLNWTIKQQRR